LLDFPLLFFEPLELLELVQRSRLPRRRLRPPPSDDDDEEEEDDEEEVPDLPPLEEEEEEDVPDLPPLVLLLPLLRLDDLVEEQLSRTGLSVGLPVGK